MSVMFRTVSFSKLSFILLLAIVATFGAAHMQAHPVFYSGNITLNTLISCTGDQTTCNNFVGLVIGISGSIDTTATPVSCGANCNTYTVGTVNIVLPSLSTGITNVPVSLTANTGGNPDTFATNLTVLGLNVTATIGIPAGTMTAATPDGFGLVSIVAGAPPYTFGSTVTLTNNSNGNNAVLTAIGTIDAIDVLHSFAGTTDGGFPKSTLTETLKGTFEGTAFGSSSVSSTLFSVTNATNVVDNLTTLHTFASATEGANPIGGLLEASNGLLYGANTTGGSASSGTIYNSVPGATTVTVVNPGTGSPTLPVPQSLIEASDGNIYGVTSSPSAPNVFFRMNTSGTATVLHTFTTSTDGTPSSRLIQANDGNFYGETSGGSGGAGMVYKFDTLGNLTPLYTFTNTTDGKNPTGSLVQASNGKLYGVSSGGAHGQGVVFNLTLTGTFTAVHAFKGTDGSSPTGGLILGSDNNLYGITLGGGVNKAGTIYKLTSTNVFSTVHNFLGPDGTGPQAGAGLTLGSDGRLYGTASSGKNGTTPFDGTVFSLDRHLPKPKPGIVSFAPTAGPVGATVLISGKNLLGAKVSFNGVNAITVHNRGTNYTTAVVPAGATTGPIKVTTPNGSVQSSTSFTVN